MNRRTEKKLLRNRIFGVMQNISHCFSDTNPFATPIPHIFYPIQAKNLFLQVEDVSSLII